MNIKTNKGVFMKIAVTFIAILMTSLFALATEPSKTMPSKEEIKATVEAAKTQLQNACTEDAAKAGCADKEIGEGLMKCIHAYKKENKDFKLSDSCKSATHDLKKKRREYKKMRTHMKEQKTTEETK